jgi:hypothetical protein
MIATTQPNGVMMAQAEIKTLHRRWRRREQVWHWAEIFFGLVAWGLFSWTLARIFAG